MKSLLATVLLLSLCSCDMLSKQKQAEFSPQSATELFDLQSKCSAMGEKLMQDYPGSDMTQQVSHYNAKDNRCYVKLTVRMVDIYLYYGQTGEVLAAEEYSSNKGIGSVYDVSLKKALGDKQNGLVSVGDLINSMVATDRKP